MRYSGTIIRTLLTLALVTSLVLSQSGVATKGEVAVGKDGMATTAHPLASQAAMDMLHRGGNAVDAAVAAAFAIGVVETDGSGIGGGGAMVVYLQKERKSIYINYYQQASERINQLNYNPATDNKSAKSILVPGTVAGLTEALERYGTLPLADVLAPAIKYAEEGFPLDETLSSIILDNNELLSKYPSTAAIYLPEGFPVQQGEILVQTELAQTLRTIAQQGRRGYYEGPLAERIVKEVSEQGGMITLDDLKNYQVIYEEPVSGTYRGYEILSAGAPQSGASIIQAMNMLENAPLKKMGHFSVSVSTAHLMAETMRRVYADRTAFVQDPRYAYVPTNGLVSKDYASIRYNDISMSSAEPAEYRKTRAGNPLPYDNKAPKKQTRAAEKRSTVRDRDDVDDERSSYKKEDDPFDSWGKKKRGSREEPVKEQEQKNDDSDTDAPETDDADTPEKKEIESSYSVSERGTLERTMTANALLAEPPLMEGDGHTTHLSVADKYGNIVSLTQTLGTFFGSGLTVAGVMMNGSLSNFSTTSSVNSIEPNKRPRSSISPTIILKDGRPFMSVGSPGASRITATVVQLIVNAIDFGMDAGENNKAPRFFCQKFDDYLHFESRFSEEVKEGLKKKGHSTREHGDFDLFFGGAQIIMFDQTTGLFYGSADPRRGGAAIGD
ncbi:MAG: gamma-glutamyltransferase family protein [Bacteroidetes bacterium]|nr:gamma-glutamyltransferase family protein [Bacteroidota bacterium]